MTRHMGAIVEEIWATRPARWPVFAVILIASAPLTVVSYALGLDTFVGMLTRTFMLVTAGLWLTNFRYARWRRSHPLPPSEVMTREMFHRWMKANRDAAPWN